MKTVPKIQLRSKLPEPEKLAGMMLTRENVAILLEGDADVFKPDGTPLLMLRRGSIPQAVRDTAYPALHHLRKQTTDNRGRYAGASRVYDVHEDGSKTTNSRTRDAEGKRYLVASAIVGYYDRSGRFPFCRETAFTNKEPEKWSELLPMCEHVSDLMREVVPKRFALQMAQARKSPDFVIGSTPFTTLTVNNNVAPAATHTDKGDFKDGLGIISCARVGKYEGAWLVFPEYMVGADLRDGDVIFFNSHDWHGVTPMIAESDGAERITVVYYCRQNMAECLPLVQELERAKSRGVGAKTKERMGMDDDIGDPE